MIDPGRAFGTGSHPTTRLCVELLARTPRGSLLDVGCGSGVLAIAASRLGFAPVLAIDVDPVAVETTRANAAANGVELDARVVDALSGPLPAADVAIANVLLAPVEAILARLNASEAITSGYLAGERPAHRGWAHPSRRWSSTAGRRTAFADDAETCAGCRRGSSRFRGRRARRPTSPRTPPAGSRAGHELDLVVREHRRPLGTSAATTGVWSLFRHRSRIGSAQR